MSFSAHKTYGPKGVGALFVRRKPRVRIEAQMHGGGHERGMRSGTLPTHQIVGMGEAFRLARLEMATDNERIRMLRDRLWKGLSEIEEVYVNGDMERRVPHNLNVSFNFVEGESLIMAIKDVAVSSGSACTSASLEPSYVLRALGRSDELAHSSIRFTVGRFTTEARDRLRGRPDEAQGREAARAVAAVGDAQGRRRLGFGAMGRTLIAMRRRRIHTAASVQRLEQIMAYSEKVLDHYENPRNVGSFAEGRRRRRHRHGRRARLRRRDEAADQRRRGRHHRGREVQDVRLRLGHRIVVARHRMGEGQDARPGDDASATRRSPRSSRCRR